MGRKHALKTPRGKARKETGAQGKQSRPQPTKAKVTPHRASAPAWVRPGRLLPEVALRVLLSGWCVHAAGEGEVGGFRAPRGRQPR